MENKQIYTLVIDKELSPLFVPKTDDELTELKHQLTYEGLQPIIITWNKMIVDGIDTYRICHDTGIPFRYTEHEFFSRNEVISDICIREIKNPNITASRRKYCIGKLGLAQHALGKEGYIFTAGEPTEEEKTSKHRFVLYRWRTKCLLKDIEISMDTIYSYTIYANAIDTIYAKSPTVALDILNKSTFISLPNLQKLSEFSPLVINNIWRNLHNNVRDKSLLREIKYRTETGQVPKLQRSYRKHEVEIKRMPQYDPDAEFSSLALTVPMWSHSITRLQTIGKFSEASSEILTKLDHELHLLKGKIENLQNTIEEELNE